MKYFMPLIALSLLHNLNGAEESMSDFLLKAREAKKDLKLHKLKGQCPTCYDHLLSIGLLLKTTPIAPSDLDKILSYKRSAPSANATIKGNNYDTYSSLVPSVLPKTLEDFITQLSGLRKKLVLSEKYDADPFECEHTTKLDVTQRAITNASAVANCIAVIRSTPMRGYNFSIK